MVVRCTESGISLINLDKDEVWMDIKSFDHTVELCFFPCNPNYLKPINQEDDANCNNIFVNIDQKQHT